MKHTPGPWSVRYTSTQNGKGGHCSVSIHKAAKSIVAKRVQGRLTLEDEANAALIAAAPDMRRQLDEIGLLLCDKTVGQMVKNGTLLDGLCEEGETDEGLALIVLGYIRDRAREIKGEEPVCKVKGEA